MSNTYWPANPLAEVTPGINPMLRAGLVHDLAGGQVERGEQIGDAVTFVVMGATFDLAGTHRQTGLGAVEG